MDAAKVVPGLRSGAARENHGSMRGHGRVLESTVIAQGLPWPENLDNARGRTEEAVRAGEGRAGDDRRSSMGVIRIGLADQQLLEIARLGGARRNRPGDRTADSPGIRPDARHDARAWAKANRRDLAAIVAARGRAATTVSATLWIARRFGMEPGVMATGGLGGVHRDAAATFDVSTDLDELARADGSLVVCSGMKSILDLPATLESLETRGVLVVGYRTGELPGFLTRSAGLRLEHRVDSPAESHGPGAGPPRAPGSPALPSCWHSRSTDAEAIGSRPAVRQALDQALHEAHRKGIAGKPLTPFLLEAIRQATQGRRLQANCALLVANARLAAEVAVELVFSRGCGRPPQLTRGRWSSTSRP